MIPLSKATVSQHLTVLKDAGLITGEVMPPRVKYSIDEENWELARQVLFQFMGKCVDKADDGEETEEPCENCEGESN